jgi:hypothetical protein
MLAANRTVAVFPSGVEEAGEAESMPAGQSGRPPEDIHANRANDLLNFPLHLDYNPN